MPSYEKERTAARDAARLAGQLCLAIRREMLDALGAMEKAGREPVTIADYGAQAIVMQHLATQFPDDGSISEEKGSDFASLTTAEQRKQVVGHVSAVLGRQISEADIIEWLDFGREVDTSRRWVVDPIDGTKGFIRGDQFAVAIGLLEDGVPVVGTLACPVMPFAPGDAASPQGIIATAVRGEGAQVEPQDGSAPTRPMRVSEADNPQAARSVESVESGHTDHDLSADILDAANVRGEPVRIDSQAKYAAVADGRAEIYLRLQRGGYRERIWDHAAGMLIVEEAGGRVTDLDGKLLDFSLGAKLSANRGILATNGSLHDDLLAAIASSQ